MGAHEIESVLDDARSAALAEGLTRIVRLHLRIGPNVTATPDDLAQQFAERFRGSLFENCTVTWEAAETGGVSLASIEGYELA